MSHDSRCPELQTFQLRGRSYQRVLAYYPYFEQEKRSGLDLTLAPPEDAERLRRNAFGTWDVATTDDNGDATFTLPGGKEPNGLDWSRGVELRIFEANRLLPSFFGPTRITIRDPAGDGVVIAKDTLTVNASKLQFTVNHPCSGRSSESHTTTLVPFRRSNFGAVLQVTGLTEAEVVSSEQVVKGSRESVPLPMRTEIHRGPDPAARVELVLEMNGFDLVDGAVRHEARVRVKNVLGIEGFLDFSSKLPVQELPWPEFETARLAPRASAPRYDVRSKDPHPIVAMTPRDASGQFRNIDDVTGWRLLLEAPLRSLLGGKPFGHVQLVAYVWPRLVREINCGSYALDPLYESRKPLNTPTSLRVRSRVHSIVVAVHELATGRLVAEKEVQPRVNCAPSLVQRANRQLDPYMLDEYPFTYLDTVGDWLKTKFY